MVSEDPSDLKKGNKVGLPPPISPHPDDVYPSKPAVVEL
jgi:hypothetical protein